MPKNLTFKFLSKVIDVRPEETSSSILLFIYFFFITSSAGIIKPVKLSLFLDQLTFEKLPFAYLLTAVFMGFFVSLNIFHGESPHFLVPFTDGVAMGLLCLLVVVRDIHGDHCHSVLDTR